MFNQIDRMSFAGIPLRQSRYFVMGQICIAKDARGKGVFAGLYREMQVRMAGHFDYIITEVDSTNPRSVRAHEQVGFIVIEKYHDAGIDWYLVLLPVKT
jgi:predicted GNAT superfamily acetyltransferase